MFEPVMPKATTSAPGVQEKPRKRVAATKGGWTLRRGRRSRANALALSSIHPALGASSQQPPARLIGNRPTGTIAQAVAKREAPGRGE